VVQVLAENIDGFELKYLDPATNTWLESWDSTQPAGQPDRLPAQVWISLWLADGPGGVPVKFETKIPIPIQVPLNFATN
jgi:general secretion pathway protein J